MDHSIVAILFLVFEKWWISEKYLGSSAIMGGTLPYLGMLGRFKLKTHTQTQFIWPAISYNMHKQKTSLYYQDTPLRQYNCQQRSNHPRKE